MFIILNTSDNFEFDFCNKVTREIEVANNKFINDQQALLISLDYLKQIKQNKFYPNLINSVYQLYTPFKAPSIYDAFYTGLIFTEIESNNYIFSEIYIDNFPLANNKIDDNNKLISAGLQKYTKDSTPVFSCTFSPEVGRNSQDDGLFTFNSPCYYTLLYDSKYTIRINATIQVPLEVGYTSAFTTYSHLLEQGGVARWPYDCSSICLLINWNHPLIRGVKLPTDNIY